MKSRKKDGFHNKKQNVKTARGRSNSSVSWLRRHINDPYVKMAKQEGYVSRAAFKLLQIEEKFKVIKKSSNIIDLGAAPGGWLQVLSALKKENGLVVGVDLTTLSIELPTVNFIQGDFLEEEIQNHIINQLGAPDLIVSDMAAAAVGDKGLDHIRSAELVRAVIEFSSKYLQYKGNLIIKLIRGGEEAELLKICKSMFSRVKLFKPDSSYSNSAEIYIVALDKGR